MSASTAMNVMRFSILRTLPIVVIVRFVLLVLAVRIALVA